jgi:hypothetical protein
VRYQSDDPFFSGACQRAVTAFVRLPLTLLAEVANLIDNIEKGEGSAPILRWVLRSSLIPRLADTARSSYEDAVKSYALTWAIRDASEKSAKKAA